MNNWLLVIVFALLVPSTLSAQTAPGWPNWMGPDMQGVWQETGILKKFPEAGPKVRWRSKIGGGYAGPAVVDQHVFLMDRTDDARGQTVENEIRKAGEISGGERVVCLDLATGKEVWAYAYDCPYRIAYPTGPRCTPVVEADRVYTLGAMGDLICLERESGEPVWHKKLTDDFDAKPPVWGFASHPMIRGEQLIVPVGGDGSGVVAFDKKTGAELWRSVTTMDVGYAPLVLFEEDSKQPQLIFWHAEGITSLNPSTGEEYWFSKFPNEPNPSQTTIATPRFIGNRLLISEFYKGSLMLQVDADPPAVTELWRSFQTDPKHEKSLNSMMTTPVIKDGHAYGISYVGRGTGVLRCIDLENGVAKWTQDAWMEDEPVVFATSFIVENDGRYIMFNDNGELMLANFTPEGFEMIDKAKILEPTSVARGRDVVWSHPAFHDRCMFVRNDKEVVCVDLSADQ